MKLVTGHKGFIGRNLVKYLESQGDKVYGFDAVDGDPIEQAKDVPWDKITQVYHLGAISNTTELDVLKIQRWNIQSSIQIMEWAADLNIPVTYASSGSVYGNSMCQGQYEYNPLNYYALSKLTVDYWVKENLSRFKAPIVGLRYFNVYGMDEKKDDFCTSPVYRFSEQAKTTGVIKIFEGSEKTYRDFVCVEDVVKLTARLYHCHGTYDVGCGTAISFLDVAVMVAKKYNATIQFIPFPEVIKGKYQKYSLARPHFPDHKFVQVSEFVQRMD